MIQESHLSRRSLLGGAAALTLVGCGTDEQESVAQPISVVTEPPAPPVPTPALSPTPPTAPTITPEEAAPARLIKLGPGGYSTLREAMASIKNASASNVYRIQAAENSQGYDTRNVYWKDHVELEGLGPTPVLFFCELPASSSLVEIAETQPIFIEVNARLINCHFRVKNCRYAAHVDGEELKGRTVVTERCIFEHKGNEEAREYRRLAGLNPNDVWDSLAAWGSGVRSNTAFEHSDTLFVSPGPAYLVHDSIARHEAPAAVRLTGCTFRSTKGADLQVLLFQSYGSEIKNAAEIKNCSVEGLVATQVVQGRSQNWHLRIGGPKVRFADGTTDYEFI